MADEFSVEAFLAREKQELAGIDDEFGALSTNDSTLASFTSPPNGNSTTIGTAQGDTFNNGFHADEQKFEADFTEMSTPPKQNGTTNGVQHNTAISMENFGSGEDAFLNGASSESANNVNETAMIDDGQNGDGTPANTLSALPLHQQAAMRRVATPTPPPVREEPAKIKNWREQQRQRLEKKDLYEEAEKKKLREQAKRELDDWYKKHNEQLDKTKKLNRDAEKELMTQRDNAQPGKEWERVAGMCEFNPKSARAAKDLSRLRSILLQMKNQPQMNGK
jgi:hypothetical protein